jgi:hypothetical protein
LFRFIGIFTSSLQILRPTSYYYWKNNFKRTFSLLILDLNNDTGSTGTNYAAQDTPLPYAIPSTIHQSLPTLGKTTCNDHHALSPGPKSSALQQHYFSDESDQITLQEKVRVFYFNVFYKSAHCIYSIRTFISNRLLFRHFRNFQSVKSSFVVEDDNVQSTISSLGFFIGLLGRLPL